MTKKYPSERTVAIINEAIDAFQRGSDAPESPIKKFHSREERAVLARLAKRIRKGQVHSPYPNVVSDPDLADIYELTIRRDEIIEQSQADVRRALKKLERLIEEEGNAVRDTFYIMLRETEEEAKTAGPRSAAARRVGHMRFIIEIAKKGESQYRRNNDAPIPIGPRLSKNPLADGITDLLLGMTAAEVIDAPPAGEPVLAFPPDGADPARGRVFFRIGLGKFSWIGSFEQGDTDHCTVQMLPDLMHWLVTANGAGYIIEVPSRTLVERIGFDITQIGDAYNRSIYFVNHGERSIEAFGRPGRLWKTGLLGCGGFRALDVDGATFVGEARQTTEPEEWRRFSISFLTGEVSWPEAATENAAS
jgi:hypothetical protein